MFSQIYKGNQSEAIILKDLLKDEDSSLIKTRFTIATCYGIARADNLKIIKKHL